VTNTSSVDMATAAIHLGLGATSTTLPDFTWSPEYLQAYGERFASDGDEGRLVVMEESASDWTSWERHPAGEEVVLLLSGRVRLVQEIAGEHVATDLEAFQAVVNPAGVWHTMDVFEPARALFITPGRGTENRPR
jgi:hypothetical protein